MRVQRRLELKDAEVVKVGMNQVPFSIRLTCCDCGLTHDVKILHHDNMGDDIEMIFKRNKRSTALNRSYRNGARS